MSPTTRLSELSSRPSTSFDASVNGIGRPVPQGGPGGTVEDFMNPAREVQKWSAEQRQLPEGAMNMAGDPMPEATKVGESSSRYSLNSSDLLGAENTGSANVVEEEPVPGQGLSGKKWRATLGEGPEVAAMSEVGTTEAGLASKPHHHIFPQEFRTWFEERGFTGEQDIDQFTVQMDESTHQAIHGGGDPRLGREWPGSWNNRIIDTLRGYETRLGRPLRFEEVFSIGEDLLRKYGIRGPIIPYRR